MTKVYCQVARRKLRVNAKISYYIGLFWAENSELCCAIV